MTLSRAVAILRDLGDRSADLEGSSARWKISVPSAIVSINASQHTREQKRTMSDNDDFTNLDDPEFLAARRRVRDAFESTPAGEASPELTSRYQAMDEEFIRRARISWGGGQ